ncbi:MAG: hypothetical protein WC086_02470, partial [Dehalococcoidales bacterium]
MQYTAYTIANFRNLPQASSLSEEQLRDIEIVGSVFPFRVNNYVAEHLINWKNVPDDPLFIATFPQKDMLAPEDYETMKNLFHSGASAEQVHQTINQ